MSHSMLNTQQGNVTEDDEYGMQRRGLSHPPTIPIHSAQHRHGAHHQDDAARSVLGTRSLWFAQQRALQGAMKLFWASVAASLGVFLLSQIPATPGLRSQLMLLGLLSLGGAAVLVYLAWHDLLGRVIVSTDGIALRPSAGGFTVSWSDLVGWEWLPDMEPAREFHQLRLFERHRRDPHVIEVAWLSEGDRHWLRQILMTSLPKLG